MVIKGGVSGIVFMKFCENWGFYCSRIVWWNYMMMEGVICKGEFIKLFGYF